jgi:Rieske Fe-S protein
MERREVLKGLIVVASLGTLGSALYPLAHYFIPPKKEESEAKTANVGNLDDFPPNSGKIVKFGNNPALVIRTADGKLKAFTAICTHLGCTVQYRPEKKIIWCACHGGQFDLTGKNIAGPPPAPLTELIVNLRGVTVILSKA